MTEYEIHKAVVQHLAARAMPGVLWFHVPNGGSRHPAEAANLKRMGVRPGVADLLLFRSNDKFALELKSAKGRLSDAQEEFGRRWQAQHGAYYVAYDLDEALAWLKIQGLIV